MKYILAAVILFAGAFFFLNNGSAKNLVTYEELQGKLNSKANFILLDVRTLDEYNAGHIPAAVLLPYDEIAQKAEKLLPEKDAEIIVYCRSGRRSAIAADELRKLGYTEVKDFGGISRWQGELVK